MLWGDGTPTREFLYVEDCVEGLRPRGGALRRAGARQPRHRRRDSIRELAEPIADVTGFDGEIIWDTSMPNGQPRRALDATPRPGAVRLGGDDPAARRPRAHRRVVSLGRARRMRPAERLAAARAPVPPPCRSDRPPVADVRSSSALRADSVDARPARCSTSSSSARSRCSAPSGSRRPSAASRSAPGRSSSGCAAVARPAVHARELRRRRCATACCRSCWAAPGCRLRRRRRLFSRRSRSLRAAGAALGRRRLCVLARSPRRASGSRALPVARPTSRFDTLEANMAGCASTSGASGCCNGSRSRA